MSAPEVVLLLGLVASEAVLIYGIIFWLAKAFDARRARRLAAERGEGLR